MASCPEVWSGILGTFFTRLQEGMEPYPRHPCLETIVQGWGRQEALSAEMCLIRMIHSRCPVVRFEVGSQVPLAVQLKLKACPFFCSGLWAQI